MKILVIGNLSDTRCGFQNFTVQTGIALQRAGHDVRTFDGTYPQVYERLQHAASHPFAFLPPEAGQADVIHVIWNAITLNHYNGADWAGLAALPGGGPLISWWDGGPSDASCPFIDFMQVRWSDYPREGYRYLDYPVPDWVTDLPWPSPQFTVGVSSVRGDGVALTQEICERNGWAMNLPTPGVWRTIDEEVRRLALSTVNVCWYHTAPLWHNRASAPSMLLAAGRPIVINHDPLVAHLWGRPDIYEGEDSPDGLEGVLQRLAAMQEHQRTRPARTAYELSWTHAASRLTEVWAAALRERR